MKFELIKEEFKDWAGIRLYRIRYSDGTKGGWLQSEKNLSQEGNALVAGNADYLLIGPIDSRNAWLTATKTKHGEILLLTGCFQGTIAEFKKQLKETHGDNEHAKSYLAALDLIGCRLGKAK